MADEPSAEPPSRGALTPASVPHTGALEPLALCDPPAQRLSGSSQVAEEPVEISDQALEQGLAIWLHGRVRPLTTYGEEMVRDFRRAVAAVIRLELQRRLEEVT
jgi:hypothetical protein